MLTGIFASIYECVLCVFDDLTQIMNNIEGTFQKMNKLDKKVIIRYASTYTL